MTVDSLNASPGHVWTASRSTGENGPGGVRVRPARGRFDDVPFVHHVDVARLDQSVLATEVTWWAGVDDLEVAVDVLLEPEAVSSD